MPTVLPPLLKWAGSKRALAETVRRTFDAPAVQYMEPCVGAACVYAQRLSVGDLRPGPHVLLADLNPALIAFYRGLRANPEGVLRAMDALAWDASWMADYEGRREEYNARIAGWTTDRGEDGYAPAHGSHEFCALFLWINRACFNGLYRVSASGKFNTPAADYLSLNRPTPKLVRQWAQALEGVVLRCQPFAESMAEAGTDWQVYVDPPYFDMFDAYTTSPWGYEEQMRLGLACHEARARGAHVVASNTNHPRVRAIYAGLGFEVREATVYHSVGATPARRSAARELLLVGVLPRRRRT